MLHGKSFSHPLYLLMMKKKNVLAIHKLSERRYLYGNLYSQII